MACLQNSQEQFSFVTLRRVQSNLIGLFELFHLYTVALKFPFSTYELVVEVVECTWYV